MSKKPMSKKAAIIVLAVVIAAAIFLGFIFLNKGDGPVMGMMLADRPIKDTDTYSDTAKTHGEGVYLIVSNSFNDYQADYEAGVTQGEDLYAAIYFVECPQGSEFTANWIKDGNVAAEEKGTLPTGPKGVITYMLSKENVTSGSYTFELYDGDNRIFEYTFSIE